MKLKKIVIFFSSLMCLVTLWGCEVGDELYTDNALSHFSVYPSSGELNTMSMYIFHDDILAHVDYDIKVQNNSQVGIYYDSSDPYARVVLVANLSEELEVSIDTTTLEEFRAMHFFGDSAQVYATEVSYNRMRNGSAAVELFRLFSRLDIDVDTSSGVSVTGIRFNGLSSAFCLDGASGEAVESSDLGIYTVDLLYAITNRRAALHYLYATQYDSAAQVELELTLGSGATKVVSATLPAAISGDLVYTLNVNSSGATVSQSDWGYSINDNDNSYPTNVIMVDRESTPALPSGVTLSADCRTIYAPYLAREFYIIMDSDDPIELYGTDRCSVEEIGSNTFILKTIRSTVGATEGKMQLFLRRKNLSVAYDESITLVQAANPIGMSGSLTAAMDSYSAFAYDGFIDGELLELELPDGYSVSVYSDDNSREWLRYAVVDGRHLIQGGFRPNDVDSDGSLESGRIIFTMSDGTTDEYSVSRQNWGIPVIWFNGNYWSKFNLRGDPNCHEDQLRVSDPLASVTDIYSYLQSCDIDNFYKIAGDAYVAQHSTPLTLDSSGSGTLFSDYLLSNITPIHICNTPAEHNTPDGFRRPTWDDWGTIFMAGTLSVSFSNGEAYGIYDTTANDTHGKYRQTLHGYTGLFGLYQMVKFTTVNASNSSEPLVLTGYGAQWGNESYSSLINMFPAAENSLPSTNTELMWTYSNTTGNTYQTKIYEQPYYSNYYIRAVKSSVAFTY